MKKKKFDLTSDIVNIELEENQKFIPSEEDVGKKKNVLLAISIEEEKRREFKTWCAKNNLKMNEAFLKGFELLRREKL